MNDSYFENFEFNINDEGKSSFDVLIELIRKKKTSIKEINIKEIVDQFIDYFNKHKDNVSLEEYSDYMNMSAYLIELKTKSLLNDEDLDIKSRKSFEDEQELFIKRLLEYEMYKRAVPLLNKCKEKREKHLDKYREDYDEYLPDNIPMGKLPKRMNPDKLKEALEALFTRCHIKEQLEAPVDLHMSGHEYSLEEVIMDLVDYLHTKAKDGCLLTHYFTQIDQTKADVDYFCMLFFVILSLTHQGQIFLKILDDGDIHVTLNHELLSSSETTANFIMQIKRELLGEGEE